MTTSGENMFAALVVIVSMVTTVDYWSSVSTFGSFAQILWLRSIADGRAFGAMLWHYNNSRNRKPQKNPPWLKRRAWTFCITTCWQEKEGQYRISAVAIANTGDGRRYMAETGPSIQTATSHGDQLTRYKSGENKSNNSTLKTDESSAETLVKLLDGPTKRSPCRQRC